MSTKYIAAQESLIKDSFFEFVKTNIDSADLSLIDDIVLSYVVAVLEDVSTDPVFDVTGFCEMIAAYFPEFEAINHATVCEWMFELEAKLHNDVPAERDISLIELSLPEIQSKPKIRNNSLCETNESPKRVHKISEKSDGGSTDSSCCDFSEEVDILQEMFSNVCTLEIKHCLAIACGDVEKATQILIHRQDNGQSVNTNNTLSYMTCSKPPTVIDDNELKSRIIERYSYIDQEDFQREHRPVAPKVEPKKLVRYRDNKIVSLKGERFTEVKKGDDVEDVSLKRNKKTHTP